MKIKIVQPGWEGFTGNFGSIDFANGVSVSDVSESEAARVGAVVRVETEEGHDPSMAQRIIDTYSQPAPDVNTTIAAADEPQIERRAYTVAELEEIADKKGIKGLREIADPLGVKGKSIAEIIREVIALNPKVEPAAQAEAPAAE